jgi:hypothetical protein
MDQSLGNSPHERLANYRLMIAAANAAAAEAGTPEARNAYIAKASAWKSLTQELVREVEAANSE